MKGRRRRHLKWINKMIKSYLKNTEKEKQKKDDKGKKKIMNREKENAKMLLIKTRKNGKKKNT
jgi:hypothetical protein